MALVNLALVSAALPTSAYAQTCGDPPPVQDERLEGDIQGKAQFLSRFLGDASLGGHIQTARTEIFSRYPDAERSRSNAYFEYQVCVLLMNDPTLTATQKIDKLVEIRRAFAQPAASSSATAGTGIANTGTQTFQGDVNIEGAPAQTKAE